MIKFLISMAILTSLAFGANLPFYKYSIDALLKFDPFIREYPIYMQDSNISLKKGLQEALQNDKYQMALNSLYAQKESLTLNLKNNPNSSILTIKAPKWVEGLKYLAEYVAESKNPVAAFQALNLLGRIEPIALSAYKINGEYNSLLKLMAYYTPKFLPAILKTDSCYGYYKDMDYKFNLSNDKDMQLSALNGINGRSLKICRDRFKKKRLSKIFWRGFSLLYYKIQTSIEIYKEKR